MFWWKSEVNQIVTWIMKTLLITKVFGQAVSSPDQNFHFCRFKIHRSMDQVLVGTALPRAVQAAKKSSTANWNSASYFLSVCHSREPLHFECATHHTLMIMCLLDCHFSRALVPGCLPDATRRTIPAGQMKAGRHACAANRFIISAWAALVTRGNVFSMSCKKTTDNKTPDEDWIFMLTIQTNSY